MPPRKDVGKKTGHQDCGDADHRFGDFIHALDRRIVRRQVAASM